MIPIFTKKGADMEILKKLIFKNCNEAFEGVN